ncbi:tetratricopeptide repeat protein [Reinekea thalattae]|uniref:Tetratricopeptide repeat protein n=1 Tax=Reinekea thalattae TaxID=2593301 RepID=A0A5C8Z4F4_9GAMM|nr:hypothetical protein [Reinekea thalattae]TXR52139.1 hypothetical protein FME95_12060 [Reinekea thalattae]
MNLSIRSIRRLFYNVGFFFSLLLFAYSSYAENLLPRSAVIVQKAQALQQEDELVEAIDLLRNYQSRAPYDRAFINRMLGVFYWQNEQPELAVDYLRQAVESGLLQDQQMQTTRRMLADLLLMQEEFQAALTIYLELVNTESEADSRQQLWLRISQSYFQLKQWTDVLSATDQYLNLDGAADRPLLVMRLGAQLELKRWQAALVSLDGLILLEPNETGWWRQSAGLQLLLEDQQQARATLALAYRNGVALTPDDLKTLAQLYLQTGVPEQAALLISEIPELQQDVDLLTMQAQLWQVAKEWQRAIDVWILATGIDNSLGWNLVRLYHQEQQFELALQALDNIAAEDQEQQERIELTRVQLLYRLKDYSQALHYARLANRKTESEQSRSWVELLQRKINNQSAS